MRIPAQRQILAAAGALGVRSALRKLYRRTFAPGDGTHTLNVEGKSARFYVYSQSNIEGLNSLGGERPTLEFLMGQLRAGDCVYDIGAATGLYTIFFAKAVGQTGQVVAFEPEDHSFERLQEHIKLNRLANAQSFRVAIGDVDDRVALCRGTVAGASRIVEGTASKGEAMSLEPVTVANGDRFVASRALPKPRVVKIDVEGYEFSVIHGLKQILASPECELVCCEVHPSFLPKAVSPEDVLSLLRSLGFSRIETHQRTKDFHAWAFKPSPNLKSQQISTDA